MHLKYLFTSLCRNGTYIVQTQEDISKLAPGRNCFYDVLENIKMGNPPTHFCLVAQTPRIEENEKGLEEQIYDDYLVNLLNGSFVINGARLYLHNIEEPLKNFRLIFYKTRKEHFSGGANIGSETIYHLGWQANKENGENVQCVINVI